ncbi:choice-of-anchor D domain-containing protein, partial [bacterium]|nr:choice-of-anchor D domain-containing protein [bacterium]
MKYKVLLSVFLVCLSTILFAQEMDLYQGSNAVADGGTFSFGSVYVGNSKTISFTIYNSSGTTNLSVTTPISVTGDYACTSQPASSVASSNGTSTFNIRFTPTTTGTRTGSFSITNNDANENPYNISLTGTGLSSFSASISAQTNVACNGGNTGGLTVSTTNGTANYDYVWSNGASTSGTSSTTNTISNLIAGTYTVTVTDNNSATATATATITEPTALSASISSQTNIACKGGSTGSLTVSPSGGTSGYAYAWSNAGTSASISSLSAGTYTVTVTDANSCTATTSATITEPSSALSASVDTNIVSSIGWNGSKGGKVSCNGFSDGGLIGSASGGTTSYTYQWSNAATTAGISGVTAGTYTITITDANSCTATASGTVTEPAALSPSASVDSNVTCNGKADGGVSASASGGTSSYTYVWSSGATTAATAGVYAGTYTVTITDANGCTATSSATVTEPADLTSNVGVDSNVTCNGLSDGGVTASVTGGTGPYSYAWSNSATTASITGLAAGTYSVTVTDVNACTDVSSNTVTEPTVLNPKIVTYSNVSTYGGSDGSITAGATGGTSTYSYAWSNSGTTAQISSLSPGTYTVTITDANGCTATTSKTVTQPSGAPSISITSQTNVACNGASTGSLTATTSSGTTNYTYTWSNASTTSGTSSITNTISNLAAGTYTVTVTDANSLTATATATVTEPSAIVVSADTNIVSSLGWHGSRGGKVSCNGDSDGGLVASVSGGTSGYSYAWSNSATTAGIIGLSAGTYTITITDANSCTATASGTVTEPAVLIASASLDSNVSCNGLSDGGLTASATGGTSPYSYAWNSSPITASISGLSAGTYSVTITDANGCYDSASHVVREPATLIATVDTNIVSSLGWNGSKGGKVSCNGYSDGGLVASASGGTSGYTYTWSNSATTAGIVGVSAGTYTVTITDAHGCTSTATGTVKEPAVLSASVDTNIVSSLGWLGSKGGKVSCNGSSDGGLVVSVSGGTSAYSYTWSNSATTAGIVGLAAGTYTVTITDANGCTTSANNTVTEPASLSAVASVDSNVTCNGLSDGGLTASGSDGTSPYPHSCPTPPTTDFVVGVVAGTYTVTITDAHGCTTSANNT